ncbi:MAG: hypothetical protein PWR01_2733 [Clostridiales bacterium]|jgi:hypothetical protein|nr:hypothetical protein [Clostridiales bacterium]MDN5281660.1 hypothetical protein [Candidatus Ozemobacter sp.]
MAINKILTGLVASYNRLVEANDSYLEKDSGIEGFRNLIDQRNLVIEDIDLLTKELVKEIGQTYREHTFKCRTIPEALRALLVLAPELSDACDRIKDALQDLVQSDAKVEAKISTMKDSVKEEISRIRRGSRVLKGYKQADPMGSCFINKIK